MPPKDKGIPILSARKEWDCPNCDLDDVTNEAQPHTRMHACPGMGGLTVPMVEKARHAGRAKGSVRVRKVLREDYEGTEKGLTRDDAGRPVMAVVTDYADGSNDAAIYPAVAMIDVRKGP